MVTTEEIVYGEAVRAIEQQQRLLDELRSRTAIVLAASGITTGFLGNRGLDDGVGLAAVFALALFAAGAAMSIFVLLPRRKGWTFELSPTILLEDHVDVPERNTPAQLHRYLAEQLEGYFDANGKVLEQLFRYFWWASVLLVADIFLWLLELAIH